MVCFSFVNIDIQPVSNPYECVFNIVVANRCYIAYFMCVVVRYTATLVLDTLVLQVTHLYTVKSMSGKRCFSVVAL